MTIERDRPSSQKSIHTWSGGLEHDPAGRFVFVEKANDMGSKHRLQATEFERGPITNVCSNLHVV